MSPQAILFKGNVKFVNGSKPIMTVQQKILKGEKKIMTSNKKIKSSHDKSAASHGKIVASHDKSAAVHDLRMPFCTQNKNSGTQNKDTGTQNKNSGDENKASDSGLRASGSATSATTSATSATTDFRVPGETVDAQIAFLESQIALLKGGSRLQEETLPHNPDAHRIVDRSTDPQSETFPPPEARSPKPEASPNDTATFLQTWLGELQIMYDNFAEIIPQLETTNLNTTDRRRLLGSGVRRYGFIEKTADVSGEFPQFWRATGPGTNELTVMVKEIEVLRNLLVWFRWIARVVQDMLLMTGDDAFRLAGSYYAAARDEAGRKNPEAQKVFDMLQLFWKRRRRNGEEPTEHEVMRDARALMRGSKEGEVTIRNESDCVVKGEKVVIDNTYRKPRGGRVVDRSTGRVVERGEVE